MKHKHAELIHAWADGALIQFYSDLHSEWMNCFGSILTWDTNLNYRIKPNSNYAKAKIAELGGDDLVELYLYWLDGGEIEFKCQSNVFAPLKGIDNPFINFTTLLEFGGNIRKKKRTVKQVLWIKANHTSYICRKWVDIDYGISDSEWHKVPTCTREIEVEL